MGFYTRPYRNRRIHEARSFRRKKFFENNLVGSWDGQSGTTVLAKLATDIPEEFPNTFEFEDDRSNSIVFSVNSKIFIFKWDNSKKCIKIGKENRAGRTVSAGLEDCFTYDEVFDACQEIEKLSQRRYGW